MLVVHLASSRKKFFLLFLVIHILEIIAVFETTDALSYHSCYSAKISSLGITDQENRSIPLLILKLEKEG